MRLVVFEGHESQRRKLEELLRDLSAKKYVLTSKLEVPPPGGWPELIAASRSGGLFDDRRITVVEGAEQLDTFPVSLAEYLEGEGADSVLVAVFEGDSKKIFAKEILKKITFIKGDASVAPWGRREWLMGLAGEKCYKLDASAAALLAESVESQEELRGELDKLALYAAGKQITVDTVRQLSFDEGGNALLRFLDGICQNRVIDVLNALRHLQYDPSPLPLLTALYNRLRPALYIACFSPHMEGKVLSATGAREYALRMAKNALSRFGKEGVKRFMLDLIRLSYLEKTSFAEGWFGFEAALWRFMGGRDERVDTLH